MAEHAGRTRRPPTRTATTWRSGSSAAARPASRRASCTCTTTSRTRARRSRRRSSRSPENDVTFSSTKLYHAYGLGNNLTFPYWVGATTVLRPGRPDPRGLLETAAEQRPTPVLQRAHAVRRDGEPARRGRARPELSAHVRVRRRAARTRGAAALAELLRPGHRGRHRLDRDAAHLLLQPTRRRPPGHERQAGARVRARPARRARARRSPTARWATCTCAATARSPTTGTSTRRPRPRSTATCSSPATATGSTSDGDYVYEGRADDMIKIGGLWASPIEIENVLVEHPRVLEAAAVGVDADYTTRVKAFVICPRRRRRRRRSWASCRSGARRACAATSTRTSSSSSTTCPRRRPARSSATSCERRMIFTAPEVEDFAGVETALTDAFRRAQEAARDDEPIVFVLCAGGPARPATARPARSWPTRCCRACARSRPRATRRTRSRRRGRRRRRTSSTGSRS